ncbi:MAG: hypothetical protein GX352_04740 [Clostridiales bacterium]|nr:hypothetical protein [Clostridiales bacterium]
MRGKGKVKRMFLGGNTPKGFISFFDCQHGVNYQKRYIIKGGPGSGKSTFMLSIGKHFLNQGYDVIMYSCATDPESLDAIFIPLVNVMLLDGTNPHAVEPKSPGIIDEIIWLGDFWDGSKLIKVKDEVLKLNVRASKLFNLAFSQLKEASVAFHELEFHLIEGFNKAEYNVALVRIMKNIFEKTEGYNRGKITHGHYFASAISSKGIYNYSADLINPEYKVYAFSGNPGSGVSQAIGRIAGQAMEMGISTEQFHCPMKVGELDLLVFPDIKIAVINTSQVLGDEILLSDSRQIEEHIDFNTFIDHGVTKDFVEDIGRAKNRFRNLIEGAVGFLARASEAHEKAERYYIGAMDFSKMDNKRNKVMEEIYKLDREYK